MLDYTKFRGLQGYGKIKRLVNELAKWQLDIENEADIYTPQETRDSFGIELDGEIAYLVYDGGALYSAMTNEFGYELGDALFTTLDRCGLCCEPRNNWSMFIFENK